MSEELLVAVGEAALRLRLLLSITEDQLPWSERALLVGLLKSLDSNIEYRLGVLAEERARLKR